MKIDSNEKSGFFKRALNSQ